VLSKATKFVQGSMVGALAGIPRVCVMLFSAFITSAAVVALAEIGDKTQLLAIVLVTRFKRPWLVIAGIFAATLVNHALAALVGSEAANLLDSVWFRAAVAIGFVATGLWTLVPDKLDDDEDVPVTGRGVFLTTLVTFFLVEMGDKTQIATIALGARFHDTLIVAAGTTAGMMLVNIPAVLFGREVTKRVPVAKIRLAAALLLIALGLGQGAQLLHLV
jgi:putative Ca2+/H+ antiporter (TMEM165/GDT1 family)